MTRRPAPYGLSSYTGVTMFGLLGVLVASGFPWGQPFPIERRAAALAVLVALWAVSLRSWRQPRGDGS